MTNQNLIPTALAHLDAAESVANAQGDILLAADLRYARTTLTLATGTSEALNLIQASDVPTHLRSAAESLDQSIELDPQAAADLLVARAEIQALMEGHGP